MAFVAIALLLFLAIGILLAVFPRLGSALFRELADSRNEDKAFFVSRVAGIVFVVTSILGCCIGLVYTFEHLKD